LTLVNQPVVPEPTATVETRPSERVPRETGWWSVSAWASFAASYLAAFTLPVIGELPAGEIVLFVVAAWALLCAAVNQAPPSPLWTRPLYWRLLVAQGIALVAYVGSDLYRHSSAHDMARGWGRMILLAIDVVAIAYLFVGGRRNIRAFILGNAFGAVTSALTVGPLFGDMWKFGVAAPITFLIFLLAPVYGRVATLLAGVAIGIAHFVFDYRSFGALCVVTGGFSALQLMRPAFRLWLAPLCLAVALIISIGVYRRTETRHRTSRSDIERSAMVEAAADAVRESPLIGHGSWFSNSDVYDNFMRIRFAKAREAHVGGFADPRKVEDAMALHSQILVSVAEGGIFGGTFFVWFGAALLWQLCDTVFAQPWDRQTPIYTLLLLAALWNLFFSPFSGAHRVLIAFACGLILYLQTEAAERRGQLSSS
jgi:hypothetical protein